MALPRVELCPWLARVDVDQQPRSRCVLQPLMPDRKEHQPGTRAPITGHFEELNIFGSPTGKIEHVQAFAACPRGFSWRQIEDNGC
jgi:hypothetical protein